MKSAWMVMLWCLVSLQSFAQYNDPNYAVPSIGYGSDGSHTVDINSFVNPNFQEQDIKIYYPADIGSKVPTLFYSHAYGGNFPSHVSGLLNFVARKGYAIVFVPYQTTGVSVAERYENLLAGFRQAARDYPEIIDTTKVGFLGHSFGGGASFALAYKCFTENNWGQQGRWIHSSAPWYSFEITQEELQSFPSNTKLIVEIYEDDAVNDHRMAADIFTNINIAASEKDFLMVKSDTINGYIYYAGHDVPTNYNAFDALDYYAYYRLIDALCDYSFNGNVAGKAVALGNGSVDQIAMPPGMKNLVQTDAPIVYRPESSFGFECSAFGNPRNSYCGAVTPIFEPTPPTFNILAYPNPFSSHIQLYHFDYPATYVLYSTSGQIIYSGSDVTNQDFSYLTPDLYFLRVVTAHSENMLKLVKQ